MKIVQQHLLLAGGRDDLRLGLHRAHSLHRDAARRGGFRSDVPQPFGLVVRGRTFEQHPAVGRAEHNANAGFRAVTLVVERALHLKQTLDVKPQLLGGDRRLTEVGKVGHLAGSEWFRRGGLGRGFSLNDRRWRCRCGQKRDGRWRGWLQLLEPRGYLTVNVGRWWRGHGGSDYISVRSIGGYAADSLLRLNGQLSILDSDHLAQALRGNMNVVIYFVSDLVGGWGRGCGRRHRSGRGHDRLNGSGGRRTDRGNCGHGRCLDLDGRHCRSTSRCRWWSGRSGLRDRRCALRREGDQDFQLLILGRGAFGEPLERHDAGVLLVGSERHRSGELLATADFPGWRGRWRCGWKRRDRLPPGLDGGRWKGLGPGRCGQRPTHETARRTTRHRLAQPLPVFSVEGGVLALVVFLGRDVDELLEPFGAGLERDDLRHLAREPLEKSARRLGLGLAHRPAEKLPEDVGRQDRVGDGRDGAGAERKRGVAGGTIDFARGQRHRVGTTRDAGADDGRPAPRQFSRGPLRRSLPDGGAGAAREHRLANRG